MSHIELNAKVKEVGGKGSRVLEFIASTETADRSGDIIDVAGWVLDNYLGKNSNPVFAWSHDYTVLPLGKAIAVTKDTRLGRLVIRVQFPTIAELCTDPAHPSDDALRADTIYNMYANGYLNAVSVGFKPIEYETRHDDAALAVPEWQRGTHFISQELLELSAVVVPCNPDARVSMGKSFNPRGVELVMASVKSVIPFKHYPLADEDAKWNAASVIGASEVDDLKVICTWYDEDNADVKSAYKLPHHMAKSDGYKTVWAGVAAAMGVLMGARGGADIPDEDKKKCYAHLAKHYEEFGKTAPEWGKEDNDMDEKRMKALEDEIAEVKKSIQVKSGAKFSASTKDALMKVADAMDACHKGIKACHKSLKDLLEPPEAGDDGEPPEPGKPANADGEPQPDDHGQKSDLDIATASIDDAIKLFAE